jgi:phosphonopyruvate decarboxylase
MGALSTIGLVNPNNLIHVLIDNGIHESTGSQPTATTRTNLGEVALACGYEHVIRATSSSELKEQFVLPTLGSKFIHFIVRPGSLRNLPRPTISPKDNALRFRENMLIN